MDGGWLEAELMAKAGANMVVVMGQAHEETIELVVKAGRDMGVKVMGDNMAMPDPVAGADASKNLVAITSFTTLVTTCAPCAVRAASMRPRLSIAYAKS